MDPDQPISEQLLHISPEELLGATDSQICLLASSPQGSKHLQHLLSSSPSVQERLVAAVLVWQPLTMMTGRAQSGLVLALLPNLGVEQMDALLSHLQVLSTQSSNYFLAQAHFCSLALDPAGSRVLQAALKLLPSVQSGLLAAQLANPWVLHTLVRDKHGTYTAQECVLHLQPGAVSVVASSLVGHCLELGCHKFGSHFLQKLLKVWVTEQGMGTLCEEVVQNTADLIFHPAGTYLLQVRLPVSAWSLLTTPPRP